MGLMAVTSYELSLFLHVTAAVVGFGVTFAESITFPVAMKLDRRHLPYVHRLQRTINTWFAVPALVVVVATGLYQADRGNWNLGKPWLSASFAIVAAIAAVNLAYFIPEDRRLEAMAAGELEAGDAAGAMSPEYTRRARNTGIAGAVTGVLVIVVIFLMVTKPGV